MNGLILEGGEGEKNSYLDGLITKNQIPEYNITRYEDSFKITDAREIIRKISITTARPRIFIINNPTPDSQNALLKTLEEMPEDTFIVFMTEKNLLATIRSRCTLVSFAQKGQHESKENFTKFSQALEDKDFQKSLLYLNDLIEGENIEEFIHDLRFTLTKGVKNGETLVITSSFLKMLNKKYSLIDRNNLNTPLALERILIEVIPVKN